MNLTSLLLRRPLRKFSTTLVCLSGHNKWSKIKDKKAASDLQKSLLYSRASHDILAAARAGASNDPSLNIQLAVALRKAKEVGLPKENIEKALGRAAGGKEGSGNRLVYEALAFDSVGLMIECYTDNINRTVHNIREILTSHRARLAPVKFMFERYGRVVVSMAETFELDVVNKILDVGIEHGASEVKQMEEAGVPLAIEFLCPPEILGRLEGEIRDEIRDNDLQATITSAELAYVPREPLASIEDEDLKKRLQRLVETLEAENDTYKVFTTCTFK